MHSRTKATVRPSSWMSSRRSTECGILDSSTNSSPTFPVHTMPYSNRILKEESSKCDEVPQPARQSPYEPEYLKQPPMQMTRRSLPLQQTLNRGNWMHWIHG
ncbi:uncharacterized protein LOC117150470 [Drosophila mauritiana]|uniref:Uncharacterized protein LOC117150470 n=1 Tax=Drosophila mauritiana TaxID=7226 RepID=A0A6P8L5N4_DROMA|nr:uncharacterized protein LOC117150470 [Drosophila mauritiana]